jgi:CubicO group peptidase (beta-lactamase class C family)
MKKLLGFLLLLILFYTSSPAQEQHTNTKIDSTLKKYIQPGGPGASILVAKGNKIIYHTAAGKADMQLNVNMQTDMIFQLASITKQFTAVAILQLMEEGKLTLSDSIQQYIPSYPYKAHITIENLLTHTSGIPDYLQLNFDAPSMERWDFSPYELIDSFKHRPLQFMPGTEYRYSNSGYFLLGYIIEKITGSSYNNYIKKNILEPLALNHTYFDEGNNIIPGRVQGYQLIEKKLVRADFWSPSIVYSAGNLLSNTEDLFKWNEALKSYKLLKKETLEKAWTPYKLNTGLPVSYGYGWSISNIDNSKCVYHTGAMNGFLTQESYYPEEDIYIVVLCNAQQAHRDELANALSTIVLGKTKKAAHIPSSSLLTAYYGTYRSIKEPKRTISISNQKVYFVMEISGQKPILIEFDTDTNFHLVAVPDVTGVFESTDGEVKRVVINQNGKYVWEKIVK